MKRVLVGIMLFFSAQSLKAESIEENLVSALGFPIGRLEMEQKQLDRGRVAQGDELHFEFPFRISSDGDVTILGIHQDCGCISQSLKAGQVLKAGYIGTLSVKVDTSAFSGPFNKSITILTNQQEGSAIVLRLKAQVARTLSWHPTLVEMNLASKKAGSRSATVLIRGASKQSLHIEKVDYNKDTFDVSYRPVEDAWELRITWKGPVPSKPWFESIEVTTNSELKVLKIPVVSALNTQRL